VCLVSDPIGGVQSRGPALAAASADELVGAMDAASRSLQSFLMAAARRSGLGLLEFLVLIRANEHHGVVPMDAGRPLGLHSGTVTGLANRLENDGLLRRVPHPDDRRLVLLLATPKGRRVTGRALRPMFARLSDAASELDSAERALMVRFLGGVASAVAEEATVAVRRPVRRASRGRGVPRRGRRKGNG
jgi:DNA-binding MarR family transcriptional regulator